MSNGSAHPELNAMIGEWIKEIPGPFGPNHPDEQLARNRAIQQMLVSKCLDVAEEMIPGLIEAIDTDEDPEVVAACSEFALEAGEMMWPGIGELLRRLGTAEGTYWKRAKQVFA